LSFLDGVAFESYKWGKNAEKILAFQYGNVLTIKKGHSLAYYITWKITAIGKESYITMMMRVYRWLLKMHDYLHENIHWMQVIYNMFYGGFIQPIQALLGCMASNVIHWKVHGTDTNCLWRRSKWH